MSGTGSARIRKLLSTALTGLIQMGTITMQAICASSYWYSLTLRYWFVLLSDLKVVSFSWLYLSWYTETPWFTNMVLIVFVQTGDPSIEILMLTKEATLKLFLRRKGSVQQTSNLANNRNLAVSTEGNKLSESCQRPMCKQHTKQ